MNYLHWFDLISCVGREYVHAERHDEDAPIVPFNVLFAYIYDAVVSGKGMFKLQITPSKNKTVALLLNEKFPPLRPPVQAVQSRLRS